MTWAMASGWPAVLVALAAPGWFTFHTAYQDGLDALRRGDAALASRAFARAIELEPTPGRQVKTYGLNFLPTYHPYLRQAEALLALGDLAGAERALQTSERLGLEPAPERDALKKRLRLASQKPAPAVASPAPDPVQAPAAAPQQVPARAPGTPIQEPASGTTRETAPPPAGLRDPGPAPVRPAPSVPVESAAPPAAQPAPSPAQAAPEAPGRSWGPGIAILGAGTAGLALVLRRRTGRNRPAADAGAPPTTIADPNLLRAFGPYQPLRLLGDGGCASAYLAVHRDTGAQVALKVPHRHLTQDPGFRARFRREAALGGRLDHPHIVPILTPEPSEEDPWIAMTFIEGTTLEAFLGDRKPLPVPWAAAIATHVAEAIAHAHAKQVVHRDLKPANIMLNDAGAWVMDFGVARVLDGTATSSTMFIGTPSYAAPECLVNPQVGPEADAYALGLIIFEMLTGEQGFGGTSAFQILEAHRTRPLPRVRSLRPEAPEALCDLVDRLCRKAPGERPGDAEILEILSGLAPIASWPPPAGVPPA